MFFINYFRGPFKVLKQYLLRRIISYFIFISPKTPVPGRGGKKEALDHVTRKQSNTT